MVVKSATKKKLMDLGIEEEYAHKLADDRKWDDVKGLSPGQIAQICGIDSGTSQRIHDVMASSVKSSRASARPVLRRPLSEEEQCPELGGRRSRYPCRTTTTKPR